MTTMQFRCARAAKAAGPTNGSGAAPCLPLSCFLDEQQYGVSFSCFENVLPDLAARKQLANTRLADAEYRADFSLTDGTELLRGKASRKNIRRALTFWVDCLINLEV